MKFLNLLILALCFCACAINQNIKKSTETDSRIIPVFMANGEQRAALKTTLKTKGKTYSFLLLATQKDGYINFKLIGDFAAVLTSVNLSGKTFEYETNADIFPPQAKSAFEEILLALFDPGTPSRKVSDNTPNKYENLRYYYKFKKGENVPYKLKQKGQINKTFLFEDYAGNIPQKITVKTKFNVVKIDFEVLSHD